MVSLVDIGGNRLSEQPLNRWDRIKSKFYSTIEKQILKEKPYKVALGCALGIGVNFFPTLGFGFVFAFFLAVIAGVSRASATAVSLLTGPLVPLMYALNILIGGLVITPVAGKENLTDLIISQYSKILRVGDVQEQIFSFLEFFGAAFLLGAVVNAVVIGTGFFFFVRFILRKRMKHSI